MVCRDERVMADVEPGEGRGRGGVGGGGTGLLVACYL